MDCTSWLFPWMNQQSESKITGLCRNKSDKIYSDWKWKLGWTHSRVFLLFFSCKSGTLHTDLSKNFTVFTACVCVCASRLSDTRLRPAGVSTHVIADSPGRRTAWTGVWTCRQQKNNMGAAAGKTLNLGCKPKKIISPLPERCCINHTQHSHLSLINLDTWILKGIWY